MAKQLQEYICIDHSGTNVSEQQSGCDAFVLETEVLVYDRHTC